MSDLISREALRKAFHERIWYFDKSSWDEANALIDNAPTVERPEYILKVKNLTAENKKRFQEEWNKSAGGLLAIPDNYEIIPTERPHGEWKFDDTEQFCYCSNCEDAYYPRPLDPSWYYCPHCGAEMRGVE